MSPRKRGSARRRSVGDRHSQHNQRQLTTTEEGGQGKPSVPDTSRRFEFECALCGNAKGRANISTRTGEWVISCWSCSESSYLFDLADALSIPGGGYILKEDPRRWLALYITRSTSRRSEPESLPSDDEIEAWKRMLNEGDKVLGYLRRDRGLTPTIIKAARLGFDGRAITIPIYDVQTRELCNLRRRFWPRLPASGVKYQGLAGRTIDNGGVTLYPALPSGSLILCAGEFDALALWSQGLPGLTVTSGAATLWKEQWNWIAKGRRVAVMFDADPREEDQAISRAAELRRAGADAWPVLLTRAGLSPGEDITDFFVKHGSTSRDLLRLINSERQRFRRRGRRAA
jgi:hypothetical protein